MYGPISGPVEVTVAVNPNGDMGDTHKVYVSIFLPFGTTILHGGWEMEDQYGQHGGLRLQLIDISTGTPVLGTKIYQRLTDVTEQYQDGFHMRAVRLDNTRAFVTWKKGYNQYGVVVQVISGTITIGTPVQFGGTIHPTNMPSLGGSGPILPVPEKSVAVRFIEGGYGTGQTYYVDTTITYTPSVDGDSDTGGTVDHFQDPHVDVNLHPAHGTVVSVRIDAINPRLPLYPLDPYYPTGSVLVANSGVDGQKPDPGGFNIEVGGTYSFNAEPGYLSLTELAVYNYYDGNQDFDTAIGAHLLWGEPHRGGSEAYPSQLDTTGDDDVVRLDSNTVAFMGQGRWYNVDGDGSTWKESRFGCRIALNGLAITTFTWFLLDEGYQRFSGIVPFEHVGAVCFDGSKSYNIWSYDDQNTVPTSYKLVEVDWSSTPPEVATIDLPASNLTRGLTYDKDYIVFVEYPDSYLLVSRSNPMGTPVLVQMPDPLAYYPDGGSWFMPGSPDTVTPRGWLAVTPYGGQGTGIAGAAPIILEASEKASVVTHQQNGVTIDLEAPTTPVFTELYGVTAVMAGTRYCALLIDFEVQAVPYNYREFMYVLEPVRVGDIGGGPSQSRFLQVRAGF